MITTVLTMLGYVVATFMTQGLSHFVINKDHYATLTYMRQEPIFAFGITSMLIQGWIISYLFPRFKRDNGGLLEALKFSWAIGAILVSYIALGEAGKYSVPSTTEWLFVEIGAGLVQFTFFGIILGFIHRHR